MCCNRLPADMHVNKRAPKDLWNHCKHICHCDKERLSRMSDMCIMDNLLYVFLPMEPIERVEFGASLCTWCFLIKYSLFHPAGFYFWCHQLLCASKQESLNCSLVLCRKTNKKSHFTKGFYSLLWPRSCYSYTCSVWVAK